MLQQAIDQSQINHIGKERTSLIAKESICWINIIPDIENTVKNFNMS